MVVELNLEPYSSKIHHCKFKLRYKANTGYILIYVPFHPNAMRSGCVLEHRLIMEQQIGRFLDKNEHVHHINRIRDDNRIENLQLMSASEHCRMNCKSPMGQERLRKMWASRHCNPEANISKPYINKHYLYKRGPYKRSSNPNEHWCCTCQKFLPNSEFWKRGGKHPHLLHSSCKACERIYNRERSHSKKE